MTRMLLIKSDTWPSVGDRIEFLSDRAVEAGPSAGHITGMKITVDGLYVRVRHSDREQLLSWDDISATRKKAADGRVLWMVKAIPTPAQIEAGNYRKKHIRWNGLDISIENPKGSVRRGTGPGGVPWETKMRFDYGYVRRSEGVDGDSVDCYVGPDESSPTVYIVHQRRAGDWEKYDEDKCMLGFRTRREAIAAYLAHYDDPRFLGPITEMPVDKFCTKVRATFDRPAMIKSRILLVNR